MIILVGSGRASSVSAVSAPSVPYLRTLKSISTTFSATKGTDQVKTSMKLGRMYGCGV